MKLHGPVVLGLGLLIGCGGDVTALGADADPAAPADARSSSAVAYGPNGTAWPSTTPAWDAPATTTVASWGELVTALGAAAAGDVVHLAAGDYGSQTLADPALAAHLAPFATNVLVRSAPGTPASIVALTTRVPNITWAGVDLGTITVDLGANRTHLARIKLHAEGGIYLTAVDDVELVEVVALERGHNNDRLHISPDYNGGTQAGRHIPRNLRIERSWLEGLDVNKVGPHSDTIQWLGMAGEVRILSTFLGAAGNNATLQAGGEFQGAEPYATFLLDTVFLGGAIEYGNGNTFGYGPSGTTYVDCEWDGNLKPYANDEVILGMTGSRVEPADPQFPDGRRVAELFPDNEYGVPVTPPTFVPPPWWW